MQIDRLTPAIDFMVREKFLDVENPVALKGLLSRGMLKDLFDQIGHTISTYPYEDHVHSPTTTAFRATLGPALDPFSARGKCTEIPCRIAMAQRFARSIGLYVDYAIVRDPITSIFLGEPLTVSQLATALYPQLMVLKSLLPLVEAGVIRFAAAARLLCRHCLRERDRLTEQGIEAVEKYLHENGLHVEVQRHRNGCAWLTVRCPQVFGSGRHELIGKYSLNKERAKPFLAHLHGSQRGILGPKAARQVRRYIRSFVSSHVDHVLFDMTAATLSHSVFASQIARRGCISCFLGGHGPASG